MCEISCCLLELPLLVISVELARPVWKLPGTYEKGFPGKTDALLIGANNVLLAASRGPNFSRSIADAREEE
jgi:hypothetical protein